MSTATPPPLPPGALGEKIDIRPGFVRALRGVWQLTWRKQLTWRRLPGQIALLMILPALILITTKRLDTWARQRVGLGDSTTPSLNEYFLTMVQLRMPLTIDQKDELSQIVNDAYTQVDKEFREAETYDKFDERLKAQRLAVARSEQRVLVKGHKILNDKQFNHLDVFMEDKRKDMEGKINDQRESWTRTAPFYHWLVDVYFFIVLPLACVRGCGALVRDELQADTMGFLITRPVGRARLLCVKYLSQMAWLQLLLLTQTLILFAAGMNRQIAGLEKLLPLFVAAQILAVPAWGALGTLLGQISGRYVAVALVYGAIVEMGIGRIPTNINCLSVMRHLKTVLAYNAPLQAIYDWPADSVTFSVCALLVAPVIFLSIAAALFSFLEYLPASEMQK